jgi:hypothetical protein
LHYGQQSMAVNCNDYHGSLEATRSLLAPERNDEVVGWLGTYLGGTYSGGEFDQAIDHDHPNEFTQRDFDAVPKLGNVHVLKSTQSWLTGEGRLEVGRLLTAIDEDLEIWDVTEEDFDGILGDKGPAWHLWKLIEGLQKEGRAGHAGTGVTAGKLLHGKRPRLIPIYDDKAVKPTLHVTDVNVWEAFWCILRSEDVRKRLDEIQQSVPESAELSTLRVLDIVVWMSATVADGQVSPD